MAHPRGSVPPVTARAIRLGDSDNVAVTLTGVQAGEAVEVGDRRVTALSTIPLGHKIAIAHIAEGAEVRKYNEVIGVTICDVEVGVHVHVHNVVSARLAGPEVPA